MSDSMSGKLAIPLREYDQLIVDILAEGYTPDVILRAMVQPPEYLSRDSRLDQRKLRALLVQGVDGMVDRTIERISVGEGLVCEMV